MAQLTQQEFSQAVALLADDLGLQRLRDRLVRMNALVTRRRVASAQHLADQLYLLTGGLRRAVPATMAVHSIWTTQVNEKLGDEREKALEAAAERINKCLDEHEHIRSEHEPELDAALTDYWRQLASAIGSERARLDMLLKAVPAVGTKVRALPAELPPPAADAAESPPSEPTE
jgi:hypothetical protein